MSLVLRMRQQGRKNKRLFRLVVADGRSPRDGKYVECVGHYNPHEEDGVVVKKERIEHWIGQGAQPSERMVSLLKRKCPEVLEAMKKAPKKSTKTETK